MFNSINILIQLDRKEHTLGKYCQRCPHSDVMEIHFGWTRLQISGPLVRNFNGK